MSEKHNVETTELSIWFFCGILLLAYGIVLFITGLFELNHPPATVLAELRPTLWWGALMTIIGAFYTAKFRPRRKVF
jgi:hypothetical protein